MRYVYGLLGIFLATSSIADNFSVGPEGIDARTTGLDGHLVMIAQVEPRRSGKFDYDNAANSAMGTVPTGVYFGTSGGQDSANSSSISDHATEVTGVMIGARWRTSLRLRENCL